MVFLSTIKTDSEDWTPDSKDCLARMAFVFLPPIFEEPIRDFNVQRQKTSFSSRLSNLCAPMCGYLGSCVWRTFRHVWCAISLVHLLCWQTNRRIWQIQIRGQGKRSRKELYCCIQWRNYWRNETKSEFSRSGLNVASAIAESRTKPSPLQSACILFRVNRIFSSSLSQ